MRVDGIIDHFIRRLSLHLDGYCEFYDDNPCKNDGSCVSNHSNSPFYTCDCAENGWYGETCEGKVKLGSNMQRCVQ